jgi:xylulokinase
MLLVLGVDSSTQSTKVEVRDAETGRLVGRGRAPHPVTHPPRSERDPACWWTALGDAVRQTGVSRVDAISVAGQQHGLVALDANGSVLRPAKLWNDTESAPDAGWLVDQLDGGRAAWADTCGSVPVAAFTIAKLSWLHRTEPETWGRLAHVLLPHDWLTYRLTGERVTDRGDASGTGYWSPATGAYRWDLLSIVDAERDWSDAVPQVLGPIELAGELTAEAAAALGLDLGGGTVVAAGTGDNMAAALGIGLGDGDVALSLGTSGTVYAVGDSPTSDATGAVAGFADATGRFLPLVCTLNATGVTDAMARLLGVDHERLDDLASAAPAGADGVVMLPYFAGERTPNRPDATGTVTGLRSDISREQLARATFEGVVCGLLDGLDELTRAGVDTTDGRLLLVGGGARSRTYRQVVADLTGRPVSLPGGDEHVALGACVQAAATLAGVPPLEVTGAWGLGDGEVVDPDERVDRHAIRARYATLRDADIPPPPHKLAVQIDRSGRSGRPVDGVRRVPGTGRSSRRG